MDYKKETIEILQKVNDDSLLEFFYRFIARVLKNREIDMDYKEETIKLIQKCNNLHWLKVIHAYVLRLLG